jgi:hypothetical protein
MSDFAVDPRLGVIQPPPDPAPPPAPAGVEIAGFVAGRRPYIGQVVHFFPHRGHHMEWYFGPYAALVIGQHPGDPRICALFWIGPKGEWGSYADIPHRSMRPECLPLNAWLGHSLPPSTHWSFVGEDLD